MFLKLYLQLNCHYWSTSVYQNGKCRSMFNVFFTQKFNSLLQLRICLLMHYLCRISTVGFKKKREMKFDPM
jgi:hypothetical protein